jgi:SAM-dependent methyltransferase
MRPAAVRVEQSPIGSYTSQSRGPRSLFREARNLLESHRRDIPRRVGEVVERLDEMSTLIEERYGVELEGLRMLDVGAGQYLGQMAYFARRNEVVGIDSDVIVQGFAVGGYVAMLRENGLRRTVKTVGRKAVGIDRTYREELRRQLDAPELPRPTARLMNAEEMAFPDASFDVVYAFVVFQHLRRPDVVLGEMIRVLRPGGILYLDLIPWTSRTGCHDIRILGGREADLPLWPHLRPDYRHLVQESAYLNRLTLSEWEALFRSRMPDCDVLLRRPEAEWLEPEARRLQEGGEVLDYPVSELVTSKVVVTWQKPGPWPPRAIR